MTSSRWEPAPSSLASNEPSSRVLVYGESSELSEALEPIVAAAGLELTKDPSRGSAVATLVAADVAPERLLRSPGSALITVGFESDLSIWEAGIRQGADHVVPLPRAAAWLADFLSRAGTTPSDGRLVAMVGGCGGVGTSTLTALLGCALAASPSRNQVSGQRAEQPGEVLVIDGDESGAGLEFFLGGGKPHFGWEHLPPYGHNIDPGGLKELLPLRSGVHYLGFGSRPRFLVSTPIDVLNAVKRAFEVTLIDTGCGSSWRELLSFVDIVLCVVPGDPHAVVAAHHVEWPMGKSYAVVRGPFPEGLDGELIAEAIGIPLLGEFRRLRSLPSAAADGRIRDFSQNRSIRRLAQALLNRLTTDLSFPAHVPRPRGVQ